MTQSFQENYNLQPHNSLAVPSTTRWFLRLEDKTQLPDAVAFAAEKALPLIFLGSGTNVVLGEFIDALVIEVALLGREVIQADLGTALIKVGAGENWHEFVIWCLDKQIYGIENLALIPGTCGAAPIQNIGAYGVELSELLESVEVFDTVNGEYKTLTAAECELGYRDSIFKRDTNNHVVISIQLKLHRNAKPSIAYRALSDYLESQALEETPENIFAAVSAIRRSKLPDPQVIPNVGSFFKNPVLDAKKVIELSGRHPDMPVYEFGEKEVKIPAAWLIDQTGWKGSFYDGVGVHDQQALVLVNPGHKPSTEILALAEKISANVFSEYGIRLEMEPRIID